MELPEDLYILIREHVFAMAIQRKWRRHSWFGHSRSREWESVKATMHVDAWKFLIKFENVRREWRMEPSSWIFMDHATLDKIMKEN